MREANLQKLEPFAGVGVADKVFVLAVPFTVLARRSEKLSSERRLSSEKFEYRKSGSDTSSEGSNHDNYDNSLEESIKEDLEILPLGEVCDEVCTSGLGGLNALDDSVWIDNIRPRRQESVHVLSSLLDIALNVHSEPRRFRNG